MAKKIIRKKDLKDKKVTIMGLGLHGGGIGTAKFFYELGAKVLVTDLKNKQELKSSLKELKGKDIDYVLGQHRSEDFINTDLVIKNPAVPEDSRYLKMAKDNNVAVDTDVGIFFEFCPAPIIGITGTKGKSTVAVLTAELLKQKNKDVILAGNIRSSVLLELSKIKEDSLVVLELSSWQLAGLKSHQKSPSFALMTNFMPDHLNRYKSMDDYLEDKKQIFKWQKRDDFLILNYDDKLVRNLSQEARSKVFYYSQANGIILNSQKTNLGAFVKGEKIYFGNSKEPVCFLNRVKLKGDHNISNVLAAITVAKLHSIGNSSIGKALDKFKGVEGRLQLIKVIDGVEYINDTAATTPEACLAALRSFPRSKEIILIAGGADKNLDFGELSLFIVKRVKSLILLYGTATQNLKKSVEKHLRISNRSLEILGPFDNIEEAVKRAQKLASVNSVVLLSPACASFGLFKHEFDRGEQFEKAVSNLDG
jgi:UDP-N-acetylmuramoylalanine--D-glutamate ligase